MSGNKARIHQLGFWPVLILMVGGWLVQEAGIMDVIAKTNMGPATVETPDNPANGIRFHSDYYALLIGCRTYQNRLKETKHEPRRGGEIWKEPVTGMEFVRVPGGCFEMGQSDAEKSHLIKGVGQEEYRKWYADELPVHRVCVDGFWIGKTEVTRGQFRHFVRATGYDTDAEREGFTLIWTGNWEIRKGYSWRKAEFEQNDCHPVVNVSWNDAKAMAKWLSEEDNVCFRLPSEAEWEYACRAGTATARFWGDAASEACRYANVADRKVKHRSEDWAIHNCDDGHVYTSPVGTFKPNNFALYDMLGNVWEWCEGWYDENYYDKSPKNNPKGPSKGRYRVLRGGFWGSNPRDLRCTNRSREAPYGRTDTCGFRLVVVSVQ